MLKISPEIKDILEKAGDFNEITKDEALKLLRLDLDSLENYALMFTADKMSRTMFRGKGENHFHIGVNAGPCPFNCSFCSLAQNVGIFTENIDFSEQEIITWAEMAESNSADGLNIMTTGTYSFQKLLEIGRVLKKAVSTPLIANTRDINHKEGQQLLDAGFVGAYHAIRLGEGIVTPFKKEKRIRTLQVFNDLGLLWMNCVEPVGSEHSYEDIADLMFLARQYKAAYSGVMRRINFPGSPMERFPMISEQEMAKMVAVSRLVMGDIPRAHCTHEPNTAALVSGANLFFPEVGASPRDGKADTGKGRGKGMEECRQMHREMGWNPDLKSNCF